MKNMLLFFSFALFVACGKPDPVISVNVSIVLLDGQGNNLLQVTNGLKESDIEVSTVQNGQVKVFNKPNSGHPKGFLIERNDNRIALKLMTFEAYQYGTSSTRTIVKLGNLGIDTVDCEILYNGNHTRVNKVWYNGFLKFDGATEKTSALFTVIK